MIAPEHLHLVQQRPEAFCKGPLKEALSPAECEHLQELIVQRYLEKVGPIRLVRAK